KTVLFQTPLVFNLDAFYTTVRDFQANVVDTAPGALRGYLSNVDKVRVPGIELETNFVVSQNFSGHFAVTWMDAQYVSYEDGPCPIERIGTATTVCDLSGKPLTAAPRGAWSASGEYAHDVPYLDGSLYAGVEASFRSK